MTAPARQPFALDLRSLALFRIAISLCALADSVVRLPDLHAFSTDAGLISRTQVLEMFGFLHRWVFPPHMWNGTHEWALLLAALTILSSLALVAGWHTRTASVMVWVLTASVQLRNPLIGGGYDALLRMLLFWAMFLPLGARWSADARRCAAVPTPTWFSWGGVGLTLQLFFVFLAAGIAKMQDPSWVSGDALALILDDEMRATALGAWLGTHPAICAPLNYVVLAGELLLPWLLLVPDARARLLGIAGLAAMTVGFGATLAVGPFPLISLAGLTALLPTPIWNRITDSASDTTAPDHGWRLGERSPSGRARQAAAILFTLYLAYWNVGVIQTPRFRPPAPLAPIGEAVFMQQAWRMFAWPATRTGWLTIVGQTRDGRAVDLFADGGPIDPSALPVTPAAPPPSRPTLPIDQYRNARWQTLVTRLVRGSDNQAHLNLYGRFLCRSWNTRTRGPDHLVTFSLTWWARPVGQTPDTGSYAPLSVWRHSCF